MCGQDPWKGGRGQGQERSERAADTHRFSQRVTSFCSPSLSGPTLPTGTPHTHEQWRQRCPKTELRGDPQAAQGLTAIPRQRQSPQQAREGGGPALGLSTVPLIGGCAIRTEGARGSVAAPAPALRVGVDAEVGRQVRGAAAPQGAAARDLGQQDQAAPGPGFRLGAQPLHVQGLRCESEGEAWASGWVGAKLAMQDWGAGSQWWGWWWGHGLSPVQGTPRPVAPAPGQLLVQPLWGGRRAGVKVWGLHGSWREAGARPVDRRQRGGSQVHQRQTGPDRCGEILKITRDQLHRKARILESVHPAMQTFIHSFIHSPNSYPAPSTCQSVPGPANTARNKLDKNSCFHGVYSLIRRQKNKIK